MRKTYKIIGNGVELENGTIIRAIDWGIDIDGCTLSGEAVLTFIRHQLHTENNTLVMCECEMCKVRKVKSNHSS